MSSSPVDDLLDSPVEVEINSDTLMDFEDDDFREHDDPWKVDPIPDTFDDRSLLAPTNASMDPNVASSSKQSSVDEEPSCGRDLRNRMELAVKCFLLEYDSYDPGNQCASRLIIAAEDLDILDHIESSVWRKFLTYMKPDFDDPEIARQTRSRIFRLEIIDIRPNLERKDVEKRIKVDGLEI